MLGDFKLWQWKVDLGQGRQDVIDMIFSLSGRERVFLNGKKLIDKFNYRFTREYEIALSNGSLAAIHVKADWSNAGRPLVKLESKVSHPVVNTQGPFSEPNSKKELSSNEKVLKIVGLCAIWAAVFAVQGGAIPAGIAAGTTIFTVRLVQDSKMSFSKKVIYVAGTVVGSWIITFLSIVLLVMIFRRN